MKRSIYLHTIWLEFALSSLFLVDTEGTMEIIPLLVVLLTLGRSILLRTDIWCVYEKKSYIASFVFALFLQKEYVGGNVLKFCRFD